MVGKSEDTLVKETCRDEQRRERSANQDYTALGKHRKPAILVYKLNHLEHLIRVVCYASSPQSHSTHEQAYNVWKRCQRQGSWTWWLSCRIDWEVQSLRILTCANEGGATILAPKINIDRRLGKRRIELKRRSPSSLDTIAAACDILVHRHSALVLSKRTSL